MKQTTFISFVLFTLLCSSAAIAQEIQVPFDSAGTMMSIDKGLEHSLQLFPGMEYFEEGRLFRKTDSTYSVEITQDSAHVITRSHISWSAQDRDTAELHITNYITREHPEFYLDQRGRANLMLGVTLLSIFAWGPSLPVMLGMTDPSQSVGAYLLFGAGASINLLGLTVSAATGYEDYSSIRYSDAAADLGDLNTAAQQNLRGVLNWNVGGEFIIKPVGLILRAGYAMDPSPYKGDPSSFNTQMITGGLGILLGPAAIMEFTYRRVSYRTDHLVYGGQNLAGADVTTIVNADDIVQNQALLSFSFRW